MKREGYLMQKIADPDNLRLAFWKAKKGKGAKKEVLDYQKNLDAHLMQLREELLFGTVSVGNYHYFKVYDPKERQICAAAFSERVLHHALMNVCHSSFERFQIYDSYASRSGKGTFAALDRAFDYQKKYDWYLKLDVRKYFDSIDHTILKSLLERRFKDRPLLRIFSDIIESYQVEPGKGVPIGNLTSQYFANHYLAVVDHFVQEVLQIKGYVRYMDDMVLWADNKTELLEKGNHLKAFINSNLALTLKPFCLNRAPCGLPFLGFLVYPDVIHLNRHSRERFIKKLKIYEHNLEAGLWDQSDYQRHVLPLLSFVKHADSAGWRSRWMPAQEYGQGL